MACNIYAEGTANDTVKFDRAVNYLNVRVATGVTFLISLDYGLTFITIPAGFYSFHVGLINEIQVHANGSWQLYAVQA
jgi:hypothetical protein